VSERGDRALIGKFEGKDLTHAWAGNVVDLCPVGALLSKDFLNKARSWELDRTASVCTGCSQGCNIIVETRDNTVVRLRPRSNAAVNEFFMCDHGRLNYRWMNRGDRLESPSILGAAGQQVVDWDVALAGAARVLKGKRILVLASSNLSNEAMFVLSRIAKASGGAGASRMVTGVEAPLPGVEDLALRADRTANGRGAELLGFTRSDAPLSGLAQGDAVIVADHDITPDDAALLAKASAVVLVSTVMPAGLPRADVVLPICNYLEEEGTLTNLRGHVQRFLQARAAPGMARPSWFVLADLANA
ncbi:partial NADH-quinone oxidoreductase subunit G, partial [Gammaproteobacteria bacterium]